MVLGKEKKTQLASNRRCSDSSNSTNSKKASLLLHRTGPAANLGPKDFRRKKKKKEKKKKKKPTSFQSQKKKRKTKCQATNQETSQ